MFVKLHFMLRQSLSSYLCFGGKPALLARRHCRRIHLHSTLSLSLSPLNSKSTPLSSCFVFSDRKLSRTISMSSRPSAFDALMSGARAAASKNKPQQSKSSPKKRKTLDSSCTTDATLNTKPNSETSPQPQDDSNPKPEETNAGQDVKDSTPIALEVVPAAKKQKVVTDKEKVATLKRKISQLKKKPNDFDPKSVASWEKGEPVPFLFLALAFDMIDQESGRILITDIACNMLRTLMYTTPDDLVPVVYLSANSISPPHEGLELGIGDASIIKVLAEAFGRTEAQIKSQYKEKGDLGLVAKASRSSQSMMRKPDPLTISKVFNTFRSIAKESGKDSQDKKKNHIKALLVAATDCEPQYLIRLLQAKLRIGLAEQTLLAALGQAASFLEHSRPSQIQSPLEEASKIVKQVYSVLPSYDKIVPALLASGVWDLPKTCNFTLGVPIGPMLAKSTKSISEILDKFQDTEFTCEYKYDGERAQIHYLENGSVEIYSRNAEWNTGKFPDVVAAVPRFKKPSVASFVMDCELVAYDRQKQKILPFQVLSTRARKNVVMSDIKVDVCVYAFDILYLNGQPLIQEQLKFRRESLYTSFEEETGVFQFATALTSNDVEAIQKFLDDSVEASCEGLIIKTLDRDATYEPSKRSNNWLKLKKDYIENIGDSLDLVPIAAFHGRGKRTGVYGAFLLACYDSNNEEYQSICKIGTGLSEPLLEERSASLRSKVISMPKPYYRTRINPAPDVWFEPSEVWEVKAADLTVSPVHLAAVGIVDANKGISLRFPRYMRIREDKTPEEASTSDQIAEMYSAQNHNHPNYPDEDEDD